MRLIIGCGGKKVEFPLTEGTLILGRERSCDICFPELSLSRRHLMCTLSGRELIVRDLNTKNGTFLGSQRIEEARLQPGVRLRAGNCVIHFEGEIGDATAAFVPPEEVAAAGAAPPETAAVDLEAAVPDAEGFEQDEAPTPLDQKAGAAPAVEQDEAARLVVRGERWYVQDPGTGVEVEIVPVQQPGEAAAPPAPERAGLPARQTPGGPEAGLPVLADAMAVVPIEVRTVLAAPTRGWLARVWANRTHRMILLLSMVVLILLIAAAGTLTRALRQGYIPIIQNPPKPPLSRKTYTAWIRKAMSQFGAGDHDQALATVERLLAQRLRGEPHLARAVRDAIAADAKTADDFAGNWETAYDLWNDQVKQYSETPEDIRKIVDQRLTRLKREARNMEDLNEARRYLEKRDYARCLEHARNVSLDSRFRGDAEPIAMEAHKALLQDILARAERAEKKRQWTTAIGNLRRALAVDAGLEAELKPRIARLERHERDRVALEAARNLITARRDAEALSEMASIGRESPYAAKAEQLRAQCRMRGASNDATTAYAGGRGAQAMKMLADNGLANSRLYNRIQGVLEARTKAWEAMKKNEFHVAEAAWKSIADLEPNRNNHYVREALEELRLLPERKRGTARQLVHEAGEHLKAREFQHAQRKYSDALLLDPANREATEGLNELKRQARLDFNLAKNCYKTSPAMALQYLEDVMMRLPATDDLRTRAEQLKKEIAKRRRLGGE